MRKQLCLIGAFAVCFMLTGCCMNHEWKEATCAEPKTCTKCGKTEGEALGHTWVEATCAEPKTCSVCGETEGETLAHTWVEATCAEAKHCSICGEIEGEPLEHTLTEANYQQPATCEVCGETVGEPLQADFEKFGLVCNAEQNIEYPIVVSFSEGLTMEAGKVIFSDYKVLDSDDTHEALEGYEWRVITVTELLDDNAGHYYTSTEVTPAPIIRDYYCDFTNTYNENTDTYTLNCNGADYTDVKFIFEVLQSDWDGNILTIPVRLWCRIPKGYDGLVVTMNTTKDEGVTVADLNDDNAFFRLK